MKLLLRCWDVLAQVVGEGNYERYCEQIRRKHPGRPVPSAREFYLRSLQDKYSRPSRCC